MAGPNPECSNCDPTLTLFKEKGKGPKYLALHVFRDSFTKKARKEEKKQKIEEFVLKVAALRNSKGGQLLIHLDGQRLDDWNHEWFDEIVVDKLTALIEDGQLFVDTYSSEWFVTEKTERQHTGFLVLNVNGTAALTTASFNTKLPTDISVVDPSTINIIKVLQKSRAFDKKNPKLLGIESELTKLHESRQIQFKTYFKPDKNREPAALVDYIWYNLRLREYICAFARVETGGSFFLGIQEKIVSEDDYETKIPSKQGLDIGPAVKEASLDLLQKKINSNILISDYEGNCFQETASQLNIFKAKFHEYKEDGITKYILEVAVRAVSGFLFYNKTGPTTHRLDRQGNMVPVEFRDWFQKISQIRIGVKC